MGLESVELVMAVEDAFEISISDEEAGEIVKVGDFYNLILKLLRKEADSKEGERCLTAHNFIEIQKSLKEWHEKDVWGILKVLVAEQLGVKPEEVTLEARFVDDLGMN